MSGDTTSLDAALDAGFGGGEDSGAPAQEESAPAVEAQVESEVPAPEVDAATPAVPQGERPRDATGKFAPKAPAAPVAPAPQARKAPAQPAPKADEPAAPAPPELKPPQHWRAVAREKWATLPREVQEDAKRIEAEVNRVNRESAEARKFAQSFEKTLTPYRAFIRGEPLQVVNGLLQTAVALQTAPTHQKAQLVAQIIKGYNVDIDALSTALSGQPAAPQKGQPQSQPQRPEQFRDPRVDEWLARQEQESERAAQHAVQEFAREAEFLNEPWPGRARRDGSPVLVRDLVANLIEANAREGIDLPLKDAYAQVVQQHPELSRVLRQREEAKHAATANAATQRVKAASSSVRSQPAARPLSAQKASLDSILDSAFAEASGR